MVYTLRFFSSKCCLFHNSNVFGSCIIHILYTGCAKIKKKIIPAPKGQLNLIIYIILILLYEYHYINSHAYCGAAGPVFKMASQHEKAFCVIHRVWDEFDYRVDVCRVTQCAHIEGL